MMYTVRHASVRSGFTLVEVLVVVAIIAVLIALAAPAMVGLRQSVVKTQHLAALRSHSTALALFASDNEGAFPFFGVAGAPEFGLTFGKCHIPPPSSVDNFFAYQSRGWVSATVSYLSATDKLPFAASVKGAGVAHSYCGQLGEDVGFFFSPVMMTHTVFAEPRFFDGAGGDRVIRTKQMRTTQVKHPGRKGILVIVPPAELRGEHLTEAWVAFADGSVRELPWNLDRNVQNTSVSFSLFDQIPIMTTRDGLNGFDQ
ncbi:MAG: prepilin-type N-terminal cleavage/methylation domain-containing protein [Phycisphaerales bacterium]